MFGDGYGYRSSLNSSMVAHLHSIVDRAIELRARHFSRREPFWVDIGSNDNTLLRRVPDSYRRLGVDPMAQAEDGIEVEADYFHGAHRATIITSIAMFYDVDDPIDFAQTVARSLAPEGIWVLEVGDAEAMIRGAWDAVCHEHLCYYHVDDISRIVESAGLRLFDCFFNDVNGGSIQAWICHENAEMPFHDKRFRRSCSQEFANTISGCVARINAAVGLYDTIDCYGASTKGNTLLQTCGLDSSRIRQCAEINPDKFGKFTPGTNIPIVPEAVSKADPPDAYLVLPWHFKQGILRREWPFLSQSGCRMIFPLPDLEII